jgi:NADH dehydrogenase
VTSVPLRLCVLGGTGFIGSALVARLVRDGHQVKVLTRNRARHRALLVLPTLELVQADPYDEATLQREFTGSDVVVNLVGILNERGFGGRGFKRTHTELPRRVLAACRATGVRRYVHMSSLQADAERAPSHYLRSKGEAERLLAAAAAELPTVVIFRPSVVFGPGDGLFNRFAGLLRLAPGVFPLACADAKFAPVYVGDVVAAIVATLDSPETAGRTFELCGPEVVTLRDIVRTTAHALGLRVWVLPLPWPVAWLQGLVLGLLPGKPFSLDNLRSASVDSVCSRNGLAELGIAPSSMRTIVPSYLRPR